MDTEDPTGHGALSDLIKYLSANNLTNKQFVERKDLHVCLSKYGKAIDKVMAPEINKASVDVTLDSALLYKAVAEHLLYTGRFDLANLFCQEANTQLNTNLSGVFQEMYDIITTIHASNLAPSLEWCKDHREQLQKLGSSLEFKIHRLQFIQLLLRAPQQALAYARDNFHLFAHVHMKDIQRLMGSFAFLSRGTLKSTPYYDIAFDAEKNFKQIRWTPRILLATEHFLT